MRNASLWGGMSRSRRSPHRQLSVRTGTAVAYLQGSGTAQGQTLDSDSGPAAPSASAGGTDAVFSASQ
eukprot:15022573-Alexandrium_andersonii.AAC.1